MARSIDNHRHDCPCPACENSRAGVVPKKTLGVRLDPDEHAAIMAAGGSRWAREVLLAALAEN